MAEALVYIDGIPEMMDETMVFSSKISKKIHRPSEEGPAVCMSDGSEYYREHGQFHRLDGPAVLLTLGVQEWWVDGKKHRTDGPAVQILNGTEEYWVDGKRHRLDGPAVIWPDGNGFERWWIDGKQYSKENWLKEREKWLKP